MSKDENENTTQDRFSSLYDPVLQDFIKGADEQAAVPVVNLFRLKYPPGSNTPKEVFLQCFNGLPEPEYIRSEYIGGCFRVKAAYPGENGKRKRKQQDIEIEPRELSSMPVPQGNQNDVLIQMIVAQNQSLMQLMGKMIETSMKVVPVAPVAPQPLDLLGMQKTIANVIKDGAENQMEVVNAMVKQKAEQLIPGSQDPEDSPSFMVDFVSGMFEKFGGLILNGNKVQKAAYKTLAQADPKFAMMEKNPEEYAAAYTEIIEGGAKKEELDAIITILGAPKPDLELVK